MNMDLDFFEKQDHLKLWQEIVSLEPEKEPPTLRESEHFQFYQEQMKKVQERCMGAHTNFSQDHIEYHSTVYKEVRIEVQQLRIFPGGTLDISIIWSIFIPFQINGSHQRDNIYLKLILVTLGNQSKNIQIKIFINGLDHFLNLIVYTGATQYFLELLVLKKYLWPITWATRYSLLLYSQPLILDNRQKGNLKLLITIIKNLQFLGHVAKEAVLKGYFSKMANENNFILAAKKKKKFIFIRWMFFYCFSTQFVNKQNYLKLWGFKRQEINQYRNKMKEKIKKKGKMIIDMYQRGQF